MVSSSYITARFQDLQNAWKTVWPVIRENFLGISTHTSQDIIYYGPLLLPAEAALLVLGVALLLWRWRHPAAFLLLFSGLAVFLIGGLVLYPNSAPPMLAHWTAACPAFYGAIAVPIGAWATSVHQRLPSRWSWTANVVVAVGVAILACVNIQFYFLRYYANPESLRIERYKTAQKLYEVQTIQSRYMASLGAAYRVIVVGESPYPYDADITRYLIS